MEGIENTAGNPHIPAEASELRYYADSDAPEAERLARELAPLFGASGLHADLPEGMPYVSHARQYEVWFSSSFRPAAEGSNRPAPPPVESAAASGSAPPGAFAPSARALAIQAAAGVAPPAVAEGDLEAIPLFSPEAAVTNVWNADFQVMTRNFGLQYAGLKVRYIGTVVRKNPKDQLLVFRGGGFLTTAYDVQVSLREERRPGFGEVAAGDRLSIVAVVDHIVPPLLGVGGHSIRLGDAQIYRRSR